MIEVKFEDLRGFERFLTALRRFSRTLREALNDVLFELTEETAQRLKDAIMQNQPQLIETRFRSISPDWVREKVRKGWRPEQLIRTGQYADAIFAAHDGNTHIVTLPDAGYPGHNFDYKDLARWLELGTRTQQPIPHWRPAREWMLRQLHKRVREEIKRALFRR
jgi:hypothetical protein